MPQHDKQAVCFVILNKRSAVKDLAASEYAVQNASGALRVSDVLRYAKTTKRGTRVDLYSVLPPPAVDIS